MGLGSTRPRPRRSWAPHIVRRQGIAATSTWVHEFRFGKSGPPRFLLCYMPIPARPVPLPLPCEGTASEYVG
jgi:hypothetical protein